MRAKRPSALGTLLVSLRKRRRVSQETLARQSGVSRAIISILERGYDPSTKNTPHPRPDTLRQIAGGLARDGDDQEEPGLAQSFYSEMMQAAGYGTPTSGLGVFADPEGALAEIAGDPEVATLLAKTARKYPDMTPDQRGFLIYALRHI